MDIGKPLHDFGAVESAPLRQHMLTLPAEFWELDAQSRARLAAARRGNAVYFYNDVPPPVMRNPLFEAHTRQRISVLRYPQRPLFTEIQAILDGKVAECFPNCDVVRVQLAELPPHAQIPPHRDQNILAVMHRLHIPLVTHAGVVFMIDGGHYRLDPDTLYELNNCVPHAVDNNSDVMRVHLLIDLISHDIARTHYYNHLDDMVAALAL